jgi:hypothetical protein
MVAWPITRVTDYYEQRLRALEDRDSAEFWEQEVLLLLTARDELHDRWEELILPERERVVALDRVLASKHVLVAKYGPLPNPNVTDRSRWWWFLHEGPQVRKEALAARELL